MFITIKIKSKNQDSLTKFSEFITKRIRYLEKACFIVSSVQKLKRSKTKFTVLKSPHVNKTAQEQFETIIYERIFDIYSYQGLLLLLILKRIKIAAFHDLTIKVSMSYDHKNFSKSLRSNLNINNNSLKIKLNGPNDSSFLDNYLKLLDLHGEASFKTLCLDSSVG